MLQVTDETSRSMSLEAFQMYYIMRQFLHNKSLIYGYCQARRIYKVALAQLFLHIKWAET